GRRREHAIQPVRSAARERPYQSQESIGERVNVVELMNSSIARFLVVGLALGVGGCINNPNPGPFVEVLHLNYLPRAQVRSEMKRYTDSPRPATLWSRTSTRRRASPTSRVPRPPTRTPSTNSSSRPPASEPTA